MKLFEEYNNKAWEEAFPEISPFLSKCYFATDFGLVRMVVATLIFKKLAWMEAKNGN